MANKLVIGLFLCYIFNEIEIFANPIDIPSPDLNVLANQIFHNSNLLAYQALQLKDNQNPSERRKKHSLDDLFNMMYYLWDDDNDDDSSSEEDSSEDSSSEEDSSEEENDTGKYDISRNCTVNYNAINQAQHIQHHDAPPSNSTTANNKVESMEPLTSTTEQNIQQPITKQEETIETATAAIPASTTFAAPTVPASTTVTAPIAPASTTLASLTVPASTTVVATTAVIENAGEYDAKETTIKTETVTEAPVDTYA